MIMGAPVFALTGYAAASLVIPHGFACRCLVWLGRRVTAGVMQRANTAGVLPHLPLGLFAPGTVVKQ